MTFRVDRNIFRALSQRPADSSTLQRHLLCLGSIVKGKSMKQITITRDSNGDVQYKTVTVKKDIENVVFLNQDSESEHWPTISANPLGAAPSPPSNQCIPKPTYGCRIAGHEGEQGIINII